MDMYRRYKAENESQPKKDFAYVFVVLGASVSYIFFFFFVFFNFLNKQLFICIIFNLVD